MAKTPYWWEVIERAKARKAHGKLAFTFRERERAGNWTTCACGKQDIRIPRHGIFDMEPLDKELSLLGVQFSHAVTMDDPDLAEKTLLKIERRGDVVLRAAMRKGKHHERTSV